MTLRLTPQDIQESGFLHIPPAPMDSHLQRGAGEGGGAEELGCVLVRVKVVKEEDQPLQVDW